MSKTSISTSTPPAESKTSTTSPDTTPVIPPDTTSTIPQADSKTSTIPQADSKTPVISSDTTPVIPSDTTPVIPSDTTNSDTISNKIFEPSHNLIEFTNYIIKRCLDNDYFNFRIFPLFMNFFVPFKNSADCISNVGVDFDFKSDYKEYIVYFKNLFFYFDLLNKKHDLQVITFNDLGDLITLANKSHDAKDTEIGKPDSTPDYDLDSTKREDLIYKIKNNYISIAEFDSQIKSAIEAFDYVKNFNCNDLHSFLVDFVPDGTPHTGTSSTNSKLQFFINACINNMDKKDLFIDVLSLADDDPELIFKKFVVLIAKSFPDSLSFNNAKFWVMTQLFSRI